MSLLRPTLPEKENGTYFILPKAGEPPQVGAEPDAWQMVAKINPAYLEFNKTARTSFRPMNLLISIWGGGCFSWDYCLRPLRYSLTWIASE
ncbi:hypothetical protein NMB33_37355 (plasmid) [Burkholderia sp. FXe9]|nr:hypothetical protein NMB33_37355 [Burkholderia sp. FXe9]